MQSLPMTSSQLPSLESNNHDFFSMLLEYLDGKDINNLISTTKGLNRVLARVVRQYLEHLADTACDINYTKAFRILLDYDKVDDTQHTCIFNGRDKTWGLAERIEEARIIAFSQEYGMHLVNKYGGVKIERHPNDRRWSLLQYDRDIDGFDRGIHACGGIYSKYIMKRGTFNLGICIPATCPWGNVCIGIRRPIPYKNDYMVHDDEGNEINENHEEFCNLRNLQQGMNFKEYHFDLNDMRTPAPFHNENMVGIDNEVSIYLRIHENEIYGNKRRFKVATEGSCEGGHHDCVEERNILMSRLNDEGVREEKQIHFTLNIDDNPTTDSENVDENPTTESENANVATNSLTIEGLGDINTNIQRYPSHTCEQIKGGYIWFVQLGPHPPIIAKSIIAVNCMNQRLT